MVLVQIASVDINGFCRSIVHRCMTIYTCKRMNFSCHGDFLYIHCPVLLLFFFKYFSYIYTSSLTLLNL